MRKIWNMTTSPRSPYKIRAELSLIQRFEGKTWDDTTQAEFGKTLGTSGVFEGEAPKTPDWVGRARFTTMKHWGFAYKNNKGQLVITAAGRQLLAGKREEEIFAKQLVKWQFPDHQHNGNEYPLTRFSVHPFVATLRILQKVKLLSKDEIALFLFTMTKDSEVATTASEILEFRERLNRIKHRVPKKSFIALYFFKRLLRFYNTELKELIGMQKQTTLFGTDVAKLKASNKDKLDEYISTHRSTLYDYADALIRYFRYTGLVSLVGEYHPLITISKSAKKKVSLIVKMKLPIQSYDDCDKFYGKYYGDLNGLMLPYENVDQLDLIVKQWILINNELIEKLRTISPKLVPKAFLPKTLPKSVDALKDLEDTLKAQAVTLRKTLLALELREKRKIVKISEDFDIIQKGKVVDPPTFLEWNTWRAFESLDVANKILPHFKFSDDMQPLSPAGGNVPDMEVYYDDFALIAEVTLKSGAVQWRDEAEPVPVHVIKIKRQHDKPVFGLFIAPKIDNRTSNVFFGCALTSVMFGDTACIIPLTIEQFRDVIILFSMQPFSPAKILSLLSMINDSRTQFTEIPTDQGIAWVKNIPAVLNEWKKQMITQVKV